MVVSRGRRLLCRLDLVRRLGFRIKSILGIDGPFLTKVRLLVVNGMVDCLSEHHVVFDGRR